MFTLKLSPMPNLRRGTAVAALITCASIGGAEAAAQPVAPRAVVAEIEEIRGLTKSVHIAKPGVGRLTAYERMYLERGDTVVIDASADTMLVRLRRIGDTKVTICRKSPRRNCDSASPYVVTADPAGRRWALAPWRELFRGLSLPHDQTRMAAGRGAPWDLSDAVIVEADEALEIRLPSGRLAQPSLIVREDAVLYWRGGKSPFRVDLRGAGGGTVERETADRSLPMSDLLSGRKHEVMWVRIQDAAGARDSARFELVAKDTIDHLTRGILQQVELQRDSVLVRALALYATEDKRWRWQSFMLARPLTESSMHARYLCWAAFWNVSLPFARQ